MSPPDRGQSTVEFALVLPLLAVVILGSLQITVILVRRVELVHVVRDAARAASVAADSQGAAERSVAGSSLPDVQVDVRDVGTHLAVTGRLLVPTDVPLIGELLPDLTLDETLTIAIDDT